METSTIREQVTGIKNTVDAAKERILGVKNEYSIFTLASASKREELVSRCLKIINEPGLKNTLDKIGLVAKKIHTAWESPEIIESKTQLLATIREINTALDQMMSHGKPEDKIVVAEIKGKLTWYVKELA